MLLFTILKVIGRVLLVLLLLILLLLGLLLLVPIHYEGKGHKGEAKKAYAGHIDICWFLRLIQLHGAITPKGLEYYFRILWFRPLDSRKNEAAEVNASAETSSRSEETTETTDAAADTSDENSSHSEESVQSEEKTYDASDVSQLHSTNAEIDEPLTMESHDEEAERIEEDSESEEMRETLATSEIDSGREEKNTSSAAEKSKKKKRKKTSFLDRIKKICKKASSLCEVIENEENQKALQLLISRVKYLLHHLRFRKLDGTLQIGFDDPATVGRIMGALSLFYPLYAESLVITPVFDHAVFEGDISFKGHVRLIHIVIVGTQLMMNKIIRGLVLDRI